LPDAGPIQKLVVASFGLRDLTRLEQGLVIIK
jgi:hypothetical protein